MTWSMCQNNDDLDIVPNQYGLCHCKKNNDHLIIVSNNGDLGNKKILTLSLYHKNDDLEILSNNDDHVFVSK